MEPESTQTTAPADGPVALGGGGCSPMDSDELVRVVEMKDFDFSKVSFGRPIEGRARNIIARYNFGDGTPPCRVDIQLPELESPWGFSYYEAEHTYSITHNLIGPNGRSTKDFMKALEAGLIQAAIGNKKRWWPKGAPSDDAIRLMFDSSVKQSQTEADSGYGPMPEKFKAKIRTMSGIHDCGGYIIHPEQGKVDEVRQQETWGKIFGRGMYYNVIRWNCIYISGKAWGNSWAALNIAKIKYANQPKPHEAGGCAASRMQRPLMVLPEGMSKEIGQADLAAELAEVAAEEEERKRIQAERGGGGGGD